MGISRPGEMNRLLPVVFFAPVYFAGPVELLYEEQSDHLVGKGEAGEGEAVADGAQFIGNPRRGRR